MTTLCAVALLLTAAYSQVALAFLLAACKSDERAWKTLGYYSASGWALLAVMLVLAGQILPACLCFWVVFLSGVVVFSPSPVPGA